jgi:glycerate 2-kinase
LVAVKWLSYYTTLKGIKNKFVPDVQMKIILAPQGFKNSLKAHEAAAAMAEGVKAVSKDIETMLLPIADGGAGTVRALVQATGGKLVVENVHGPLGDKITAAWGRSGDGVTAFIEVAAASGLSLLTPDRYNPMKASTYGTGELILAALKAGCTKMIVGLGDSATVDGGMGIAEALGIKLTDDEGYPVPPGGEGLLKLKHIDISGRNHLLEKCRILCACDVTNPLYGSKGAAYVYGPQKGADAAMVKVLDEALWNYSNVVADDLGWDISDMPGAGAAGGLGAGMVAFLGATLQRGVSLICDAIGFDTYVKDADLVLTGEGRIDFQTAFGKAAVGIAGRAKAFGKPVIAICGSLGQGYEEVYKHRIDKAVSIMPPGMTVEESMRRGAELLKLTTTRVVQDWLAERNSKS